LLSLREGGLELGDAVVQLCVLGAEILVIALRVEGVTEPVDRIPGRLQRPARTLLEGAEDGGEHALDPVERTTGSLLEVEAEEGQRGGDERHQDRPSAAYLLAIHVGILGLKSVVEMPLPERARGGRIVASGPGRPWSDACGPA